MNITDLPERIAAKILVAESGCWEWTGARTRQHRPGAGGYALYHADGKLQLLHRWTYQQFVAPIPDGMQIDHLCRVRNCVRPDHLEPVTAAENARRGSRAQRTHCKNGHEYTPENTQHQGGARRCRECHRATLARGRARRQAVAS